MHTAQLCPVTGLVAFSAGAWPGPAALALISPHASLREEARGTPGALGGPLPLVWKVVAEKGLLVMKARVTFRAGQWALPRVGGQMSRQVPL